MDQAVGGLDVVEFPGHPADPLGERPRGLLVDVHDAQLLDAERARGVRDRRPGAAGAQQHHAVSRNVGQPAGEALGEARRVRVVADRSAVAYHDGVDGLELLGLGRELVEVVDDLALARVRDVQAAPAVLAGRLEQLLRLGAELLDVEQPVLVRQPLARRLALVQRGAQ